MLFRSYFFCDYKEEQSQKLENIFSALAVQLALQDARAFRMLASYHSELNPENGLKKEPEPMVLLELIRDMTALFTKSFIVVDGLDECGTLPKFREPVITAFRDLAAEGGTISMTLLSRDEHDIQEELSPSFMQVEIAAHPEDIELYVAAEMAKRRQLNSLDVDVSREMRQALIRGAHGM